jgi:hypothetical protein
VTRKKRIENDAYFTRRKFDVDVLLEHLQLGPDVTCLEPCVGGGDIARFLPGRVYTNDIDHQREAGFHLDATAPATWKRLPPVDWVISNPPFNVAHLIVPRAYEHARVGVAMMLRLTWLEPADNRASWLKEHPLTRQIVLPRFSFDGSGSTDSVTCAWMIWLKSELAEPAVFIAPLSAEVEGALDLFKAQAPRVPKALKPRQLELKGSE